MDEAALTDHLREIETDGYTIIEDAIAPDRIQCILERVREIAGETWSR